MRRAGIQQQASTPRPYYTGDIMFTNIHHVSYLVPNLDDAVTSYSNAFGAELTGRGHVANLGEVAFLQVGAVEVEFIHPDDPSALEAGGGSYVIHHVAYVVEDLDRVVAEHRSRGFNFLTDEPFTNFMGYRLIYFDPADTGGCRVHLTDAATFRM